MIDILLVLFGIAVVLLVLIYVAVGAHAQVAKNLIRSARAVQRMEEDE